MSEQLASVELAYLLGKTRSLDWTFFPNVVPKTDHDFGQISCKQEWIL